MKFLTFLLFLFTLNVYGQYRPNKFSTNSDPESIDWHNTSASGVTVDGPFTVSSVNADSLTLSDPSYLRYTTITAPLKLFPAWGHNGTTAVIPITSTTTPLYGNSGQATTAWKSSGYSFAGLWIYYPAASSSGHDLEWEVESNGKTNWSITVYILATNAWTSTFAANFSTIRDDGSTEQILTPSGGVTLNYTSVTTNVLAFTITPTRDFQNGASVSTTEGYFHSAPGRSVNIQFRPEASTPSPFWIVTPPYYTAW